MRSIMVANPKGGCGKTTLATNLAGHYANQGARVALADCDPQASSLAWLAARPAERPAIVGIAASPEAPIEVPRSCNLLIVDAPAGIAGKGLKRLARQVQTLIVPVLPSPIDMRAAAHFVGELTGLGRVERGKVRVGLVANRVREKTLIYQALTRFIGALDVPFLTSLRDAQSYIRAADRGLGIAELAPFLTAYDRVQWQPLLNWLDSAASQPGNRGHPH